MKKTALMVCLLVLALACGAQKARAQGGASRGPDPSTIRDADLEKESMHNLEVARHYFKLKKAYRAALGRCEEIIAANPNFARMDEVLYIAGESSLLLAEGKGRQQRQQDVTPDKLREDARGYLAQLVKDFPDSPFHEQAEKDLNALGGTKKTVGSKQ
jgi:hypothetical protein